METAENTIGNNNELEVLRKQILDLREELKHSKITNDKIMRRAMGNRSSWLDKFVKAEAFSLPFLALILFAPHLLLGSSVYPVIVFFVLAIISTWLDWYTLRIASKNILTMSLSQLRESLVRQKKHRLIQTIVETPIAILWMLWYVNSIMSTLNHEDEMTSFLETGINVGFIVGVIVALVVIVIIYNKAQTTNNDLIETIDLDKD